ncbi:hypothetical protein LUZ61_016782 [Rhynchospora tenuis]|uniref:Reverse transcriptase domain-containing protein n=1 Tax=Rhynchospora tenuis TaxID=198213 RepID=A0AAD6EKE5_9POAL|nr:hypothetical protein LUZ61_016782 [Rhynchospora tenuis]
MMIRFLDLLEEYRNLSDIEFDLRISLREHAFNLIQIQEEKWKTRSGAVWLRLGDKNTKYFHAMANFRRLNNSITSLQLEDRLINSQSELLEACESHFVSVLGSPPPQAPPYLLTGKLGPLVDLSSLSTPFTESEIRQAIKDLPSGKASGPDGFPIEFYKNFWEIIGNDIMEAFNAFYQGNLALRKINKASITLVPKTQNPISFSQFRPISVINSLIKIISKAMATRLQLFIPVLVSPLQTAFSKGRSIMESFMVAREFLSFYHKRKIPALLYKVDFAKAFDTVSWTFLTNVLVERGFPPQWISCLLQVLQTSSSSIKVNGDSTPFFLHKRGLRQGDPLSPLLFIIVTDALQSFISNAVSLTSGPIILPPRALQYADDTIILMEATPQNVRFIRAILQNFALLSGLKINNDKSVFVPVALPQPAIQAIHQLIGCQPKELPITYLGLPLSIRQCRKIHFKPLIDAFHRKLDGWQAKFLSLGGRLTLVKAVLTAMPLYYMQVIKLPPWLLKTLEGIRRRFFWKGKEKCLGGHCLVNWHKCCLPKENGGLGIINLATQNQALLTKWLWKLQAEPYSTWSNSIRTLYGTTDIRMLREDTSLSHGLRDILSLQDFYLASTTANTVTGLPTWRWTQSGSFSSSSAYRVLSDCGIRSPTYELLWKLKSPPRVKVFLWLLLADRLLTQTNLILRGWPSIQACQCCSSNAQESANHLFLHCDLARQLWMAIQVRFALPSISYTVEISEFWQANRTIQDWDIIWAATSWSIWKERNARIFSSLHTAPARIVPQICMAVDNWKNMA